MDSNRREFNMGAIGVGGAAPAVGEAAAAGFGPGKASSDVWHRRVKRMIQISFNESDSKLTGDT